jgi:hypothetical protein
MNYVNAFVGHDVLIIITNIVTINQSINQLYVIVVITIMLLLLLFTVYLLLYTHDHIIIIIINKVKLRRSQLP